MSCGVDSTPLPRPPSIQFPHLVNTPTPLQLPGVCLPSSASLSPTSIHQQVFSLLWALPSPCTLNHPSGPRLPPPASPDYGKCSPWAGSISTGGWLEMQSVRLPLRLAESNSASHRRPCPPEGLCSELSAFLPGHRPRSSPGSYHLSCCSKMQFSDRAIFSKCKSDPGIPP